MSEIEELKNKVQSAVHLFLANDVELLTLADGVHEQAISHRIAVYLETLFEGFHVDCEYNKHLESTKRINVDLNSENTCKSCKEKLFRPDILIHKRGKNDKNIIAIEIKKNKNCPFDEEKLKALTNKDDDYKYKLGVFIYFHNNEPKYKFFIDGQET